MRLVNVGVIGVGRMGLYHALNVSRGVAEARLIAVADVRLDLAKRAAQLTGAEAYYQDYQRLLEREDIDAVCIATPSVTHAKICIEAAEAGKDIFCENQYRPASKMQIKSSMPSKMQASSFKWGS